MTIDSDRAYAVSSLLFGFWLAEELWEIFIPETPKPTRAKGEGPSEYKNRVERLVRQRMREYLAEQLRAAERTP